MKNSSYYIASVRDRTHDLPHTVASNMVKVSHALNHSATAAVFADDIVLYGNDEIAMTEYVETWRRALEDIDMRISRPKTQFIDFQFGEDTGQ